MPNPNDDSALGLQNISLRYEGSSTLALDGLSLELRRGEMAVVMGASGAGKSSLLKCVNRTIPTFVKAEVSGKISVLGRDVTKKNVSELAGIVGFVSQDFEAQLFATNVMQEIAFGMEQLGMPAEKMKDRVPELLRLIGLDGYEKRDPSTLSGGEKQRLAIAATIALDAELLLFDEPTTDLDPQGKAEVLSLLAGLRETDRTLMIAEHEIIAAEHADRLILLREGKVVANDTPDRLLRQPQLLLECSVRAPEISQVAKHFDLAPPPTTVNEAAGALLDRGFRLRSTRVDDSDAEGKDDRAAPTVTKPLLEVSDLCFRYDKDPVLQEISLNISSGDFIALIGHNGSGKTTLAKHFNGLLKGKSGSVRLGGKSIDSLPLNQVAMTVGFVFQDPDHQLFSATVVDEVAFAPRACGLSASEIDARVDEALRAVDIDDLRDQDPFLLNKGQRQRVAVASLLSLRPRLLILDEPTTGLDYPEQVAMMEMLQRLQQQGVAIVIITHTPWIVARFATRAIVLEHGRLAYDGPLGAFFANKDLLDEAEFVLAPITQLGQRFGFPARSVDEFVARLAQVDSTPTIRS